MAAIFCAVLIGRMFVVKEQVADLHHRLDPLTEDLFSYHGNQTIRQEAFFIDLEAKALRFEARYRRAPPHVRMCACCASCCGVAAVCRALGRAPCVRSMRKMAREELSGHLDADLQKLTANSKRLGEKLDALSWCVRACACVCVCVCVPCLCMCVCVSACLPACLSASRLPLSPFGSVCLSQSVHLALPLSPSVCVCVCVCVSSPPTALGRRLYPDTAGTASILYRPRAMTNEFGARIQRGGSIGKELHLQSP